MECLFVDLVVNCEDYPAFLPWCAGGRILEQNGNELSAELQIDFKGIKQSFSTRNRNIPGSSIEMELLSGPFKSLRGNWRFTALAEDACRVEFELEYHFASSLLEKIVGPVFSHITATFVDAFVQRAEARYAG
ncbi:MAG: type II toxin-antitoxin system RatA family toxin [Betaproteobacteria bacterium]|nr:type II toxin-antitoxin system RatA family toxin [Betaproteobacteria bacterium]